MKFTEEDMNLFKKNIKLNKHCPNCGSEATRGLSENAIDLMVLNEGPVGNSPFATIPAIMVTCPDCGYISLFKLDRVKQL